MASFIQPYIDKENASQVNVMARPRAAGLQRAPVGKTFQSNQNVMAATPATRRALGDVNTLNLGPTPRKALESLVSKQAIKLAQQGGSSKQFKLLKPPAPASKPPKPRLQENLKPSIKKAEEQIQRPEAKPVSEVKQRVTVELDDIEHMPLPVDVPEDDFEDLWPAAERPATYIAQLKAWRPSCIIPVDSPECSDNEDGLLLNSDSDDPPSPQREECLSDYDLSITWEDESQIENIPLPRLEDFMPDADMFSSLH